MLPWPSIARFRTRLWLGSLRGGQWRGPWDPRAPRTPTPTPTPAPAAAVFPGEGGFGCLDDEPRACVDAWEGVHGAREGRGGEGLYWGSDRMYIIVWVRGRLGGRVCCGCVKGRGRA